MIQSVWELVAKSEFNPRTHMVEGKNLLPERWPLFAHEYTHTNTHIHTHIHCGICTHQSHTYTHTVNNKCNF